MTASVNQRINGKCLCGAVSFDFSPKIKWVAHCHCSQCRRAHGAAFVTWVGVDDSSVNINSQSLNWYQSSTQAQRGFCKQCGSTLFFRSSNWPGELHISRANITDAIDQQPQVHAYFDSHVEWVCINDELPKKNASEFDQPPIANLLVDDVFEEK